MTTLVERAQTFGGYEAYPGEPTLVRVPAASTLAFCVGEMAVGSDVDFVECLYLFHKGGTQPSMDLSASRRDFKSDEAFIAFVADATRRADERANAQKAAAFFEIGVTVA